MITASLYLALVTLVTGELLTSYIFQRTDCLASTSFPNDGALVNYALRPTNKTVPWSCPRSNGLLSTSTASSSVNLYQIQSSLRNKSFSIELWLVPATGLGFNEDVKILNFGGTIASYGRCRSGLLQASQVGAINPSMFRFGISACNSAASSVSSLLSPQYNFTLSANGEVSLIHLVINMDFQLVQVGGSNYYLTKASYVIDGKVADTVSASILLQTPSDATTWDASNPFVIFPTDSTGSSSGNNDMVLYYFGLRNQTLSNNEIQIQFNNSIPLSGPVTYPTNVTVLENGQVGDESKNPAFFTRNVSSEDLSIIVFGLYNLNQDPISPNYRLGNAVKSQVFLTSSLPEAYGQLYFLNGSDFDSSYTLEVPWDDNLTAYALRYRPPYNSYSIARPTVEIDFYAIDKLTNLTSSSVPTLSVYVQRVLKPPVATPVIMSSLFARKHYTIQLTGTFLDNSAGRSIVSANITQFPQHGELYLQKSDGLLQLMSNHSEKNIHSQSGQINVIYMFTGKENASEVVTDYFSFTLLDNNGLFSLPANVTVSAITALSATAATYYVQEDMPSMITIDGNDAADIPRTLHAILRSQPILGGQVLNSTLELTPYHTGETFAGVKHPGSESNIHAVYLSPHNYFTTPDTTVTGAPIVLPLDGFEIQITDDSMTAYSRLASLVFTIQNVNDPTTITRDVGLNTNLTIQKYSGNSIESSVLTLYNFTVIDPDLDTNLIRVKITSTVGFISLSQDALPDIDFNSYTYCHERNQLVCIGDGMSNSEMLFVSSPSALAKALNGMTYYSNRGNVHDTINITIYDGEGGACLNRTLLDPITIFNGCFTTNFQLQVYIESAAAVSGSQTSSISQQFLSTNLKYILIGLIVLILIILIRWCCAGRLRKRKAVAKQKEQHQDNNPAARSPERHNKSSKKLRTIASPADLIVDDDDEESVVYKKKKNNNSMPTLDHYPKMISLADITTPPRRKNDLTPPSSSRSHHKLLTRSDGLKQQQSPASETKTKSTKSSKKKISSTASSTPTKVNSLDRKSSHGRRRDLSLSATTQDIIGVASSASTLPNNNSHATAGDTPVLSGGVQTSTVPNFTGTVAELKEQQAAVIWTAHQHSSGRTYYYNKRTKKSVWVKPADFI